MHVFVAAYIHVLFGLRLRDPQTMFKVFRRDCIERIDFHSNYFDFDYELLLKVVRKGYEPMEIPVNYRSDRSNPNSSNNGSIPSRSYFVILAFSVRFQVRMVFVSASLTTIAQHVSASSISAPVVLD